MKSDKMGHVFIKSSRAALNCLCTFYTLLCVLNQISFIIYLENMSQKMSKLDELSRQSLHKHLHKNTNEPLFQRNNCAIMLHTV